MEQVIANKVAIRRMVEYFMMISESWQESIAGLAAPVDEPMQALQEIPEIRQSTNSALSGRFIQKTKELCQHSPHRQRRSNPKTQLGHQAFSLHHMEAHPLS
ncbi:MAG: hypothetical protein ABI162_04490 [Luteolibacter sp.]